MPPPHLLQRNAVCCRGTGEPDLGWTMSSFLLGFCCQELGGGAWGGSMPGIPTELYALLGAGGDGPNLIAPPHAGIR